MFLSYDINNINKCRDKYEKITPVFDKFITTFFLVSYDFCLEMFIVNNRWRIYYFYMYFQDNLSLYSLNNIFIKFTSMNFKLFF